MAEYDWIDADTLSGPAMKAFLQAFADLPEGSDITLTVLEDDERPELQVVAIEAGALRVATFVESVPLVILMATAHARRQGVSPFPTLIHALSRLIADLEAAEAAP